MRRQAVELRALCRLGVQRPALDEESIGRIETLVDVSSHRQTLAGALDRLSQGERDVVTLQMVHELDNPAIARRLGCSEGPARVRVHRGLARLADLIEPVKVHT